MEISEASEELLTHYLGSDFVGVPSDDTFSRFFSLVNPASLECAFRESMSTLENRLRVELDKSEKPP